MSCGVRDVVAQENNQTLMGWLAAQGDIHVAQRRLLNQSFSYACSLVVLTTQSCPHCALRADRVKTFADDINECYQRASAGHTGSTCDTHAQLLVHAAV